MSAASHTWSGALDGAFSKTGNWSSGGAPAAMEAQPVDLTFPLGATTYLLNNDLSGLTIHSITIADNGYGISGSGITLTGDLLVSAPGPSLDNLDPPVTLSSGTHLVNIPNTGSVLQMAGVIGGSGDLSKTGAGSFTLSAANTYTGLTGVNAGILTIKNGAALGSAAAGTTVSDGATLAMDVQTAAFSEPLTLNGTGVGGQGALKLIIAAASSNANGVITLNAPEVRVGAVASSLLAFQGIVQGAGGLTIVGGGQVHLTGSGPNTYAGSTTVISAGSGTQLNLNKMGGPAVPGVLSLVGPNGGAIVQLPNQLVPTAPISADQATLTLATPATTIGPLTLAQGFAVIQASDTLTLGGDVTSSPGPGTFSSGIFGPGTLSLGAAGRLFTVADGPYGDDFVVNAVITGSSVGLTKAGPGRMVLSAANLYNGPTVVNAGTLVVNGSQGFSNVTVNAGGTLGGTGTVRAINVAGGAVHPGLSPGILAANVSVSFDAASTFGVELNGTAVGTGYDQLNVTGTVALAGTLAATVGFSPVPGTSFTILNNDLADPITGTFNGLPEAGALAASGKELRISYVGGTGNDVTLTVLPPPSVSIDAPTTTVCPSQGVTLTALPIDGSGSYPSYQWYRNVMSIGGASSSVYTAFVAGSYTVTVTDSVGFTSAASGAVVLTDDTGAPTVTAPAAATVTQTLCM